jgi:ferredoxin
LIAPDGRERTLQARANEHIWDEAHQAGIRLPALCHQGWCLTCAARVENDGCVDQRDSAAFYPEDKTAGFALLCTGKPCSDLRIRTRQARAMRQHRLKLGLPAPYSNL